MEKEHTLMGNVVKPAIWKPESGFSQEPGSADVLILDSPASRTVKNNCLLFKSPSLWSFLF
uniref:Uncharacterized protein n=1 Tax=Sus scrofa TaxID=9823 RepID=A0A8D1CTH0_PIG